MMMSGETWEYRTVDALDPELDLDRLGCDGWELVTAVLAGDERLLYFKRLRPSFRERVTLDQKRQVYARHGLALPDVAGPLA